MTKTDKKPKQIPLQENFSMVIEKFERSSKYLTGRYVERWAENTQIYNNERTDVQYIGASQIFVPETFTILQTIKAHILGGDPKIHYAPTRAEQEQDTEILTNMVDYIWEVDHMDSTLDITIDDFLAIGNAYLVNFWDPVRKIPRTKYFHAQDMFFDLSASNYEEMGFFGFRYNTTKRALAAEKVANPNYIPGETGNKEEALMPRYKNLEQIEPIAAYKGDKMAKAEKEQMLLGSQFEDPDLVECLVYIDKERMITIVNRRMVIEDVETPFQRKAKTIPSVDDMGNQVAVEIPAIPAFLPFAPFRNYVDGNLWYARSEIDVIKQLQERLNDVKTQKFDNLAFLLNKMFTLDPAFADRVEEVVSAPGAVLTFPAGALDTIDQPSIGTDADNEIESIKSDMQRATAADELVQGAGQDQGSLTATEVRAQLAQAGTRFNRKLKQLANEGLRIWANNILKLVQIYVDQEIAVRWIGPEGAQWQGFNPGQYMGDYEAQVMLEAEYQAKNEEEKQNGMQFFLLASKMPFVDQRKLFVETGSTLFSKKKQDLEAMLVQPMMGPDGQTISPAMAPIGPDGQPMGPQPGLMPQAEGMAEGIPGGTPALNETGLADNTDGTVNMQGIPT